jgi:hypothetical protein
MHAIPITELENLPNQLVVGDKVEVTRRNGDIVEFRVEKITESGIKGKTMRSPMVKCSSLELLEATAQSAITNFSGLLLVSLLSFLHWEMDHRKSRGTNS